MNLTETVQCPICAWTAEVEVGIVDSLTLHLLQFHTPWRLAKELAQVVFAQGRRLEEGDK